MRKRDLHDLSNYSWSSCKAGELTPLKCTEVLPNDTVKLRSEAVIRLDALEAPTMHPLKVKLFHFYGANRQVWPNWNDFITQGYDGAQSPVHPYFNLSDTTGGVGTLPQRLGLPVVQSGQTESNLSALPIAHFWNIYTKYFTDPNIQAPIPVELTDGDNTTLIGTIFGTAAGGGFTCPNVNWKKDYFNTARVDPELGGAVPIPQSNIVSNGQLDLKTSTTSNRGMVVQPSGAVIVSGTGAGANQDLEYEDGLVMDESAVMRDLSIAGALQLFREHRQDWGSRIIDYLRKGFGSKISSYELQEPILLNYGEKTIRFSEVLQTAEGTDPVGTLRGHGIGGLGTNSTTFTVPENGFIITLAYIMPEPAYLSSAERHWFKNNFTDYYQSEFEAIGNQEIPEKEIAFGYASNTGNFGYTNRYDEYRRSLNTISGTFATTEKNWHMARDFSGVVPSLNPAFLIGAPTQRIFSDTTGEVYKIMAYNEVIARRNVKRVVRRRIL